MTALTIEAHTAQNGDVIVDHEGKRLRVLVAYTSNSQPAQTTIEAYAAGEPTRRLISPPNKLVDVERDAP